jgi:hypothetical protein
MKLENGKEGMEGSVKARERKERTDGKKELLA